MNMKEMDKESTRYLDFDNIKKAFHDAEFKLSTKQVEEMLSDIKQNRHKQYNYHILL